MLRGIPEVNSLKAKKGTITMQRQYTCCQLGLCGNRDTERNKDLYLVPATVDFPENAQPDSPDSERITPVLTNGPSKYIQFSQYALEALYRFQCSMQTIADSERLAYELSLAETEQN